MIKSSCINSCFFCRFTHSAVFFSQKNWTMAVFLQFRPLTSGFPGVSLVSNPAANTARSFITALTSVSQIPFIPLIYEIRFKMAFFFGESTESILQRFFSKCDQSHQDSSFLSGVFHIHLHPRA